ncbi:uncharacterized protein LOC119432604 isoform X2 [Dermacentor silvarum]|uniref:uncharacterized protein LOC119432604 isoform X2 n=1 Tax=Dermacentor silvarum TaxID=543639 RepID=UPI0018977E87|nr:uncharacterized protein LOC119432604 isoform X2 [Dermacentor silvarum]
MEASIFAASYFVVENVLDHLETEELFTCAEVNRLWQSVALFLLRRKLVSVSVCCTPDSERATLVSALGSSHVCVDIFCSKFSRFRNIARMAGLRPSLVFLSHHVDLSEDKRAVERLREFLPPDSVIVYFKLELVGTVNGTDDAMHEGIFGEFLFRAEEDVTAERQRTTSEEADDQPRQPPDGAIPGPSSLTSGSNREWWRPRVQDTQSPPKLGLAAALPGPTTAVAPLPLWSLRPRLASTVGCERGALFRNVLPGVLVFQTLHVTAANLEGNAVTSYFAEDATGRTVQVTSAAVFSVMQSSQLEPFMRRLSEQFGSTNDTIAVAFPRNQDEALDELEAFERYFPSVPALANQATEFNLDGQYAPLSRLKMILLLIKLLD